MTNTNGKVAKLSFFDVTSLVIGAIIGADIYVASSFGAKSLGPFSLVVWVIAGIIALVIALCFAECASLVPKVGGPYAYARKAWGPFAGFMVGWSLWFAEWISLAVFPIAFTRYVMFLIPNLSFCWQVLIKALFVTFLAATNIIGVKAAGRTNDVLTVLKLAPLVFFAVTGVAWMALNLGVVSANFTPFAPYGLNGFGGTLILIFWAYAGFELSTIPAEEIDKPTKTIPRAIVLGIALVIVFYLTTNTVLFGVRNWTLLATDTAPLSAATTSMLSSNALLAAGAGSLVTVGALISISGSDESGMIGTTRLSFALAADGLFPKVFAKIHPKFNTPYASILVVSVTAFAASLIGNLGLLISVSVFFLAIAYLATCASIFWFRKGDLMPVEQRMKRHLVIPALGILFSVYLIVQCTPPQIAIGGILLAVGVPIYIWYSPRKELTELKNQLLSPRETQKKIHDQEHVFIAHAFCHLKNAYRKLRHRQS